MNHSTWNKPIVPDVKYTLEEAHEKFRGGVSGRVIYVEHHPNGSLRTKEFDCKYFDRDSDFREWLKRQ